MTDQNPVPMVRHMTAPLHEGGHGFETGIPLIHLGRVFAVHERDHLRNKADLSHDHGVVEYRKKP